MQEESPHVSIDRLDVRIKAITTALDAVRQMSIEDAAMYYVEFRDIFDWLDEVRDRWASVKDQLSKVIMPEVFEKSNVDGSITLKNGYRVTISYRTLASMTDKVGGMQWMRDNPNYNLITETVSASSLAAMAKKMAEENQSLPNEYFNVSMSPTTSVTKAKK